MGILPDEFAIALESMATLERILSSQMQKVREDVGLENPDELLRWEIDLI